MYLISSINSYIHSYCSHLSRFSLSHEFTLISVSRISCPHSLIELQINIATIIQL